MSGGCKIQTAASVVCIRLHELKLACCRTWERMNSSSARHWGCSVPSGAGSRRAAAADIRHYITGMRAVPRCAICRSARRAACVGFKHQTKQMVALYRQCLIL